MLWRFALLYLVLLGTSGLRADDISLIRVGDSWSYLCGTNAPSSPLSAWRQGAFDDSGWSNGISGFSTLTQPDFYEATWWPGAENYHSVFVRRRFTVNDLTGIKWLILRLNYDDGFVAYLNGQEIARRGLTNDPVAFDAYSDPRPPTFVGGSAEEFDLSASTGLLIVGENLLAIEVHTAVTNESGNTNSMRLVPELLANFQRGPFIQNATTNSIQVIWRTPVPADSIVSFGTNQDLGAQVSDAGLTTNHVITLTNLQPGAQYFYAVESTAGAITADSATNSFHTLKMSGDLTFLVLGDTGSGSPWQYAVANRMRQTEADLVLQSGDAIDIPYFTFGLEDARCLSVFRRQMASVPFFFALGNHEVDNGALGTAFLATFQLPTNSVSGTSHFYSFDHGDAHFVAVYMPFFIPIPAMEAYRLYEGSAQYNWLTNDLASSSKPWKFLFLHHPLATSGGSHRDDHYNGTQLSDAQVLQNLLLPVAKRYGVEMIFSGHDHDYERFNPINGVQLIVNGSGGSWMIGMSASSGRDGASSQFYMVPEFLKASIHGDSLLLQAIGTNGNVFDYMTLQRSVPPPQVYEAAWNTPQIETDPANDGRGNLNGQTFDFIGTPIPALAGDFSNLGRLLVNSDSTNLFLGFDQPMFYSNNNIFLFIETSGQSGVTNLVGLGNGVADTGEGVDGLDFLENLSFTNFAPSIACVLGDEYADGQFRNFARPGFGLNIGQGIFRLNSNFTSVAGIRLQQFNRSPQAPGQFDDVNLDRNANLIEMAIPFDQLGGLRPGDTIKIAAVVGLAGYDTNAQTREIDTGFLGSTMAGSGQSNVLLGAVSVHLAPTVLTVTADDQVRAYGATNRPLTVSYSGFVNGEDASILNGSPVITTAGGTNSPVAAYPITVSTGTLSNAHYRFVFVNGALTVTQAVLSVTGDNQVRTYGATNPLFTGTILGILNGDGITASYSTVAGPTSPIGNFPIVPALAGAGLTNYAATTNNGTLTVTAAALTVTADNQTRPYGATNPAFTATIVGLQNNDVITASCSTPANPGSPAGSYVIVPALAGAGLGNYAVSTNRGTLTVTVAPLTVRGDDQTRSYGATNSPLTFTCSGFGNGQGTNILVGSPVLSTVAETNSLVGTYAITVSQGTLGVVDTNYNLVFADGTLTVTQAVLTVQADDQTRGYGATNAPLTFAYSGFVNGHGMDLVSSGPELSTVADTNSPVGTYAITVSQGTLVVANTNYRLALVDGTLTVTQALLSVTADNQLRSYGATNPVLTGTILGIQNNDSITASYSTAGPISPIGGYAIVPVLAGAMLTNYAVTINNGTLTVTPAALAVIADNQTRVYGTTNPVFTCTMVGIQNSDPITASYSTPANPASPVGSYAIVPSPSGPALGNYTVITNNGTLTVSVAPLTVRADDQTRSYGVTNAPLTFTYSGIGIGQGTNILSGGPVLTTSAGTNSPVGLYAIVVNQGTLSVADTNYNLVITNGTLTVTQAMLAVTANDQTRVFGTTNAPLTFSYSGFVNGQGTNILSGSPGLSTVAATNSSVGTYAITVTQGTLSVADTNYGLALVNGVLTIMPASSTTTLVSSQNPSTNGDNVTFTATVGPVAPAAITPTGNATFRTNGVVLGTAQLNDGVATISTWILPAGTQSVEAEYTGDGNFLGSSNSIQQVVFLQCSSTNYILSIVKNDTNTFTFTFLGTTNALYYLLTATDLTVPITNWSILADSTNMARNGVWYHTVTNEGEARFFRARALAPCP